MILQITLAVLKLNKVMNIYGVVLLEYVLFLLLSTRIFRKTTCMIRTQNKARNALGVIWSNDIVCMMPGVGAIRHD